jgi:hypothetical protein
MKTECRDWRIEEVIPHRDADGSLRTLTVSWRDIKWGKFKCVTFDQRDLQYIREAQPYRAEELDRAST